MIKIAIPSLSEFDTIETHRLVKELTEMDTFAQIPQWDDSAAKEITRIQTKSRELSTRIHELENESAKAERDLAAKNFIARLFASREPQKKLQQEALRLRVERTRLDELSDRLQAVVDMSPNSLDDLKDLVKELRLRKKELKNDRREVTSQMTEIRTQARQNMTQLTGLQYAKWERRDIRLRKEAALQPHENEKSAIDRQLIQVDQLLAWLERIKD